VYDSFLWCCSRFSGIFGVFRGFMDLQAFFGVLCGVFFYFSLFVVFFCIFVVFGVGIIQYFPVARADDRVCCATLLFWWVLRNLRGFWFWFRVFSGILVCFWRF